jgi:hypothetical protein
MSRSTRIRSTASASAILRISCRRRRTRRIPARQPIYDRAVGHWKNYERHLGELIDVIAPIRDRYRRYERA